jgi:hypothetical protein
MVLMQAAAALHLSYFIVLFMADLSAVHVENKTYSRQTLHILTVPMQAAAVNLFHFTTHFKAQAYV